MKEKGEQLCLPVVHTPDLYRLDFPMASSRASWAFYEPALALLPLDDFV